MTKVYNNPKIVTDSDRARQVFIDAKLTYKNITKADYYMLIAILEECLERHNKKQRRLGKKCDYIMHVEDKRCLYKKDKIGMKYAYIQVKCDHYSTREGISFNNNGWIGMAGWASSSNLKPIARAFKLWALVMKAKYQLNKYKFKRIKENAQK